MDDQTNLDKTMDVNEIWSKWSASTTLHGVSEVAHNKRTERIFWTLMILTALGMSFYFQNQLIRAYLYGETSNKITVTAISDRDLMESAITLAYCPTHFIDPEKIKNIPREILIYGISLIPSMPGSSQKLHSYIEKLLNVSDSELNWNFGPPDSGVLQKNAMDFKEYADRKGFNSLIEFLSSIAIDVFNDTNKNCDTVMKTETTEIRRTIRFGTLCYEANVTRSSTKIDLIHILYGNVFVFDFVHPKLTYMEESQVYLSLVTGETEQQVSVEADSQLTDILRIPPVIHAPSTSVNNGLSLVKFDLSIAKTVKIKDCQKRRFAGLGMSAMSKLTCMAQMVNMEKRQFHGGGPSCKAIREGDMQFHSSMAPCSLRNSVVIKHESAYYQPGAASQEKCMKQNGWCTGYEYTVSKGNSSLFQPPEQSNKFDMSVEDTRCVGEESYVLRVVFHVTSMSITEEYYLVTTEAFVGGVGGIFGLFLGMSILTLIDLIVTVVKSAVLVTCGKLFK